jgi:hypothetical protein
MPKQSSTEMEVIVTLDEDHLSQITEVAEQLNAMGLRNINTLGSIGAISGRISSGLLDKLQGIPGVSAIEPSGSVHIAPPESDIQ